MNILLAVLVLASPFALAALLSWVADRRNPQRDHLARLLYALDRPRIEHDADAARTRFEQHPTWPGSGVTGERR